LTTTHPGDYCTANVIIGNYFENSYYYYGVKLIKCANTYVAGNGFEDAGANFIAGIRMEGVTVSSTNYPCLNNYLMCNFANGYPMTSQDSLTAAAFNLLLGTSGQSEYYQLGPIQFNGTLTHPDLFTYNQFVQPILAQPVGNGISTGAALLIGRRAAGETTNPGTDIFDVYYDGHMTVAGGGSGNIAFNNQDGTANVAFQNRGTKWVAIGQSGMTIDVGPTNSWLDIKSYGTRISDQNSGPLRVRLGAGKDGIDFGAASDATVQRAAAGVVNVGKLAVTNSAAATTPGTVVKKIEVFDASGNSLGFVPVYSTIT
jgi:hypothetical protein